MTTNYTATTIIKSICSSSSNGSITANSTVITCTDTKISTSDKYDELKSCASENDSDDSFIVFQETSSEYYNFTRIRQVSECSSDDFIIFDNSASETQFCFDTTTTTTTDDNDTTDSDSSSDDDTYNELCAALKKKKQVRFNLCPIVHVMHAWKFAYAQARRGHWHQIGWDRERFHKRINDLSQIVTPILCANHRQRIYTERFHENTL